MASGDTLVVFVPHHNEPPAASAATADTRNSILVLDFDATTDEEAVFPGFLPSQYAGGGLTVTVIGMASTATSGNVVLQGAFERMNTDEDADSFASFQGSGQIAANGTSGIPFTGTIAFTAGAQMDSLAAEEPFRFKLRRDADSTSATDDMTGDYELLRIEIAET